MESAPHININASPHESFKVGYDYLKSRVSYVFINPKSKPETWLVSYWSLKVQRSSIVKYGTEEDKLQLSTPTFCNKAKKQNNRMNSDGRQMKRRRKKKLLATVNLINENDQLATEETKEQTEVEEQLFDIVSPEVNEVEEVEESMKEEVPESEKVVTPKSTFHSCSYAIR